MKVFVSWSGSLSCNIAKILKKWIPCIIQSVDIFFSPEDIEKGDNWDKVLSSQLSECKYGIICLTSENNSAPWINFEAGAIAKSLDSKVTALMVNIKPSDIKGPLARYQATKFEKKDFFQLIESINKELETPLDNLILRNAFEAMWGFIEDEVNSIIGDFSKEGVSSDIEENNPIEEILQLLRKQNTILSNPQNIIPLDYIERIQINAYERNEQRINESSNILEELLEFLSNNFIYFKNFKNIISNSLYIGMDMVNIFDYHSLFMIIFDYAQKLKNRQLMNKCRRLYDRYNEVFSEPNDNISKNNSNDENKKVMYDIDN